MRPPSIVHLTLGMPNSIPDPLTTQDHGLGWDGVMELHGDGQALQTGSDDFALPLVELHLTGQSDSACRVVQVWTVLPSDGCRLRMASGGVAPERD